MKMINLLSKYLRDRRSEMIQLKVFKSIIKCLYYLTINKNRFQTKDVSYRKTCFQNNDATTMPT